MRLTRYFTFTRTNPTTNDYDMMLETSDRINASIGFKTIRDGWKVRLVGYIILRGPLAYEEDIARCFPNFLVTKMGPGVEMARDWLKSVDTGDPFFVDGFELFNARGNPYQSIKKTLF